MQTHASDKKPERPAEEKNVKLSMAIYILWVPQAFQLHIFANKIESL